MANKVAYYQRLYQANEQVPLWLRHPRSKLILYPFYALFGITCVAIPAFGLTRAISGKKAEKGSFF
ncbi:cytochrome c oxidase subunit 7, mitochondrial [Trichomonascus vanleenenianus]|uniref:cytochrome c oxidase subunit VII n=1 Tax=Trichomonascus vanleenenianus TaxID=2268995 RepID=UPI003EC9EBE8